jgi:pimeloyl-ACP methyl ester carboxylesterase
MDVLKIEKAILAGFDWGARVADIIAALWPERCKALVSVSGYLIGSQESGKMPLPPKAELQWWYQYYFATERGRMSYDRYGKYSHRLLKGGVGHNLPQEAPQAFVQAVVDADAY